MKKRKMVLGDIHGELAALEKLFTLSSFDPGNDLLIQVGDICDRGAYSFEVVELLKKCKHLVLIEGNHDQWLKSYIRSGERNADAQWLEQGGLATINSYRRNNQLLKVHLPFYEKQLPYYVDEEQNCFVHGGFNRHELIALQDISDFAWNRTLANEMMDCKPAQKLMTKDKFRHIYIGHTPTIYWGEKKPITRGAVTNIDTGCGKGGLLTIMNVDTGAFWQSD